MKGSDRVCLIIPPSPFLIDERVFMSLGVLKVAATLESAGYNVEVMDLSGISNYCEVLAMYLENSTTKKFGITSTTPQLPFASELAWLINESGRDTILGGPHATGVNAAYKSNPSERTIRNFEFMTSQFGCVVAGDGELGILPALAESPPPIIDFDDRKTYLQDLDLEPFPARHLVDTESYRYQIDGVRALSLISQLGCPFNCGFCCLRNSPSFRVIRSRSSGAVVEEMAHLYHTYGIKGFMFYDDELNINTDMIGFMESVSELQDKLGVEFRLRGFIKSQLLTDEQAKSMYDAGFRWILVGFESGNDKILKNINKRATRDENSYCVEIAKAHGLKVKALMSLGHPGETDTTIYDTERWLLDVQPEDFDLTIITTYPGSPYYDEAVKTVSGDWCYTVNGDNLFQKDIDFATTSDYYKGDPIDGYHSYVYTEGLSQSDIVGLRGEMEGAVRAKLGIPFPEYQSPNEHSMGQGISEHILRSTDADTR